MKYAAIVIIAIALACSTPPAAAHAQQAPATATDTILVLRAYATDDSGKKIMGNNHMIALRRFLPMIYASKLAQDKRLNIKTAIGNSAEEDAIDANIWNIRQTSTGPHLFLLLPGLQSVAEKYGARFVLLIRFKTLDVTSEIEDSNLGFDEFVGENHTYFKYHLKTDFEIQFIDLFANYNFSYPCSSGPHEFIMEFGYKQFETILDNFKNNATSYTLDDRLNKQIKEFTSDPIGMLLASCVSYPHKHVIETINGTHVAFQPRINADSLIDTSLTEGNQVNLFNKQRNGGYLSMGGVSRRNVYGVFVAAGDFDGDKHDELAISAGFDPGDPQSPSPASNFKGSLIEVFRVPHYDSPTTFDTLQDLFEEKVSGAYVTAGDYDGDGKDELAVSQTMRYDNVKIFRAVNNKFDTSNPFAVLSKTFNSADGYSYGAFVTSGDFDKDGKDELVISKINGGDNVRVFSFASGAPVEMANLKNLFDGNTGGAYVAAGDFDGDAKDELIVSRTGGQDHVKIFSYNDGAFDTQRPFAEAYDKYGQGYNTGVFAAAGDYDGDGKDELVLSATERDNVTIYKYDNRKSDNMFTEIKDNYKSFFINAVVGSGQF